MPQLNVTGPDPENVPPYEGRSTGKGGDELSEELTGTVERQLSDTKTGRVGVGAGMTRAGEDLVEEDAEDRRPRTRTQGQSERPVGTATRRDPPSIDPQGPDGPTMPIGGSSAGS